MHISCMHLFIPRLRLMRIISGKLRLDVGEFNAFFELSEPQQQSTAGHSSSIPCTKSPVDLPSRFGKCI